MWSPRKDSVAMLDFAMGKIKSVPYKVNSRWVFYRLVQAGFIQKSEIKRFDYLLSRARKEFYGDFTPETLTDSIRQANFRGEFFAGYDLKLDSIEEQEYYVQLWFEAGAMHGQFEHFTRNYRVSLIPFRGDCSIPIKWEIAKKLEGIYGKYHKPIRILYFGDCDKKGFQILEAALADIRAWCKIGFEIERIGLTLEQAREFGLPENPDKPNSFQWESVESEDAERLILSSLSKYLTPVSDRLEEREKVLSDKIRTAMTEILEAV
jgi:hypothetical protein